MRIRLDAFVSGCRAILTGKASIVIAGGVEGVSRAPLVMEKADESSRTRKVEDTTIGRHFANPRIRETYGTDSMPETAEKVARECGGGRDAPDAFALPSQQRTACAKTVSYLAQTATVSGPQKKSPPREANEDERPRPGATLDAPARLKPVDPRGTVPAGDASGVNDGAAAVLPASEGAARRYDRRPRARLVASAAAGAPPRVTGLGPVPATGRVLDRSGLRLDQIEATELNEAFAAQDIAPLRRLGTPDDGPHVNAAGGAIAPGDPLGASGARFIIAVRGQLERTRGRRALGAMCIGVGQAMAAVTVRV